MVVYKSQGIIRLVSKKMIDFTIGIRLVFMIATGIAIFKLRKKKGIKKMKEINKNVILVNDRFQLEMKEVESGDTIRSIFHFGVYTEKLDKHIFKGKKELRVREVDFDQLAYNFCSPYGDINDDVHLILEEGRVYE